MNTSDTPSCWEFIEIIPVDQRPNKGAQIRAKCKYCGEISAVSTAQYRRNVGAGCGKCYTRRRTYDTREKPCTICGALVAVRSNYSESYVVVCRNPECTKKRMANISSDRRARSVEGLLHSLVVQVRSRSKRKGITFDLDAEWAKAILVAQDGKCALTGVTLLASHPQGKRRGHKHTVSIDRIDPNKGYTKDNCWLLSYIANIAKNAHSVEDLMEFASDLLRNNGFVIVSEGTRL